MAAAPQVHLNLAAIEGAAMDDTLAESIHTALQTFATGFEVLKLAQVRAMCPRFVVKPIDLGKDITPESSNMERCLDPLFIFYFHGFSTEHSSGWTLILSSKKLIETAINGSGGICLARDPDTN